MVGAMARKKEHRLLVVLVGLMEGVTECGGLWACEDDWSTLSLECMGMREV